MDINRNALSAGYLAETDVKMIKLLNSVYRTVKYELGSALCNVLYKGRSKRIKNNATLISSQIATEAF